MNIAKELFGTLPTGEDVEIFTLRNEEGLTARVITYGATLQALSLDGNDVVLGYDTLEPYLKNDGCLGATIGRVANRIKDGKFTLNGRDYQLAKNNGGNTLHGGNIGFHQRLFTPFVDEEGLHLTYVSPEGEEGFPGQVTFTVTYRIARDNTLVIDYDATTTADTPFQVTNHSYFNLDLPRCAQANAQAQAHNGSVLDDTEGTEGSPHAVPTVLDHTLQIASDAYDPNDETGVAQATQRRSLDDDSIFDFRQPKKIGADIKKESQQLLWARGYDHAFVLRQERTGTGAAAVLSNGEFELRVHTSLGYLHVYTGNYLDMVGKGNLSYGENAGVALEAEHEPNAINAEDLETRKRAILTPDTPFKEHIAFQLVRL